MEVRKRNQNKFNMYKNMYSEYWILNRLYAVQFIMSNIVMI